MFRKPAPRKFARQKIAAESIRSNQGFHGSCPATLSGYQNHGYSPIGALANAGAAAPSIANADVGFAASARTSPEPDRRLRGVDSTGD
jgi:hypothetical protein